MMLKTNFPTLICWGSDYIQLYNDAFRPINGSTKHPQALGGSAKKTYEEIWDIIGPLFENVMAGNTVGFPDFKVGLSGTVTWKIVVLTSRTAQYLMLRVIFLVY